MDAKMTDETIEQAAKAAAEWWVKAIKNPKFDNGDDSPLGGMALMMAAMGHKEQDEQKLVLFGETLEAQIVDHLKNQSPHLSISVDYGPDQFLSKAINAAGINGSINDLPWKTNMHINEEGVAVFAGYGAPRENIVSFAA